MSAQNSLEVVKEKRQVLTKRRESLLASFSRSAELRKRRRLDSLATKITHVNELLTALDGIEAELCAPHPPGPPRFSVSSLFLHESFKKLTADRDEQFFFITGTEVAGRLVLDQWAEFAHQKRSFLGVTAETKSTHRLLIKLEQFGHRLLGHFHSHPGNGPESTNPSGTDTDFQSRLEQAGHIAVMVIFSRDGFVRFLRLDKEFQIEIYGEGVEQHANNVYRLTNLDPA